MTTSLSPCTRLSLLSVAVAGIFAPAVSAQTTIVLEDPVVVTATRVAEPLSEAAASISVITAKTIEENVPQTFAETLLDVPNVDVTSSESVMFNRVSIRGSDANQITYLIDGMRQEDTTIGGNQPVGLFIDPEMVKQVEVRRGGGSSLYGNGGIGGTVAVTTKDAAQSARQVAAEIAQTQWASTARMPGRQRAQQASARRTTATLTRRRCSRKSPLFPTTTCS